jgi:hypothetical protein
MKKAPVECSDWDDTEFEKTMSGEGKMSGRAEGKIKADGTMSGNRAEFCWSAHWLEEKARHCANGSVVPRISKAPTYTNVNAAP